MALRKGFVCVIVKSRKNPAMFVSACDTFCSNTFLMGADSSLAALQLLDRALCGRVLLQNAREKHPPAYAGSKPHSLRRCGSL